jgi:hypothetical protein
MKTPRKTRNIVALSLLLATTACFAQKQVSKENQPSEVKSLNKLRLTLLGAGYEREQKIGKTTTFYAGASVETVFLYGYEGTINVNLNGSNPTNYSYTLEDNSETKFCPAINVGLRHYYNIDRRIKKGKSTLNNAGGYFGFDVMGILPTDNSSVNYQINLGPTWGFQTNVGKKVNFDLSLSPGIAINNYRTSFYGIGGKIGFSFLL